MRIPVVPAGSLPALSMLALRAPCFAASVFAAAIGALPAQDVTSPPGYLDTEVPGFAASFASFPAGRYLILDGEYRGSVLTLKGIAARADALPYTSFNGMGRSWSAVVLDVYEADHDGHTAPTVTLAGIARTTPATVFNAAVKWPTRDGRPPTRPAAWDYHFPFSRAWTYSGQLDICADWSFRGGVLENAGAWPQSLALPYYLEGQGEALPYTRGPETYLGGGAGSGGCIDRGSLSGVGGYTRLFAYVYGSQFDVRSYRDQIRLYGFSYYSAPARPVLHVLGFGGGTGLPFPGVACNQLFVDFSANTFLYLRTAGFGAGEVDTDFGAQTMQTAWIGAPVFLQAAWHDSINGRLHLSQATKTTLPAPPGPVPKRRAIYQSDPTLTHGHVVGEHPYLPLFRYSR